MQVRFLATRAKINLKKSFRMDLLILFIVLNIINVMLQTFKTITTVGSGKTMAAIVNAIAYGFYTVVIVYTLCDLPIMTKALIVGLCNLVGVYVVKYIEETRAKDKLWKIEFTSRSGYKDSIIEELNEIPFNYIILSHKHVVFNAYCSTKSESEQVKNIISKYECKYFITESKLRSETAS